MLDSLRRAGVDRRGRHAGGCRPEPAGAQAAGPERRGAARPERCIADRHTRRPGVLGRGRCGRSGRLESEAVVRRHRRAAAAGDAPHRAVAGARIAADALPGDGARPQRAGAPATEREALLTELQATLESTADGILVTDLAGRIRAFNRRFAQLWDMPPTCSMARRTMRCSTGCGAASATRAPTNASLAALQESTLTRAADTLQLLSGQTLEMVTQPQVCRGPPDRPRVGVSRSDRAGQRRPAHRSADHHRCLDRSAQPALPGRRVGAVVGPCATRPRRLCAAAARPRPLQADQRQPGHRRRRPRADRGGRARQDLPAAGRPAGAGGRRPVRAAGAPRRTARRRSRGARVLDAIGRAYALRGQSVHAHLQHRHCAVPVRRQRRQRADAPCRNGDAPRQAGRPRGIPFPPAEPRRRPALAHAAGPCDAPGARPRSAFAWPTSRRCSWMATPSSAPRRWCAGATPSSARWRRRSSSRWPRSRASSSRSATGCSRRPCGRPPRGAAGACR